MNLQAQIIHEMQTNLKIFIYVAEMCDYEKTGREISAFCIKLWEDFSIAKNKSTATQLVIFKIT